MDRRQEGRENGHERACCNGAIGPPDQSSGSVYTQCHLNEHVVPEPPAP